jgi:hypothetical protein
MTLRIFAITKPGLAALALSVAGLWSCVGMEAATHRRANRDTAASLQALENLRRRIHGPNLSVPARVPKPGFHLQRPYSS